MFKSIMSCERVADLGKPFTYEPRFEVQHDFKKECEQLGQQKFL
jgi:hypothetical protein